MRIVTWTIRIVVFLLLAAFAAKNVEPVSLRFYFDLALTAPLIVMVGAARTGTAAASTVAATATSSAAHLMSRPCPRCPRRACRSGAPSPSPGRWPARGPTRRALGPARAALASPASP